jgi:hypothetical protein
MNPGLQDNDEPAVARPCPRSARYQPVHQHVVIDPVEELLQVHIDHDPVALLHMLLCLAHRIMRAAARPKAVTRRSENVGSIRGCKNLQQGLLDQPVRHRRDPQLAQTTTGLRNLHPAHRRWPVDFRAQ